MVSKNECGALDHVYFQVFANHLTTNTIDIIVFQVLAMDG